MPRTIADLSPAELTAIFERKYRHNGTLGPIPARRQRYGYFSPEDYYEALIDRLVGAETSWLDVGCGRALFPSNPALSEALSGRCASLTGVDPDPTIHENPYVHRRIQGTLADLPAGEHYQLVTMRMVAEHVADPPAMLARLAALVAPGGLVVVYTINRYSPVPLVTHITPFALHHPVKRLLWQTEAKDTFPTTYRMNTRATLARLFADAGFTESGFWHLDDCRTLQRVPALNIAELATWWLLNRVGLRYPENCLLGVYTREALVRAS